MGININRKFLTSRYVEKYNHWQTPALRLCYAHLITPRPPMRNAKPDQKLKYEITVVQHRDADMDPIFDAAEDIAKEKKPKDWKYAKWPWKELGVPDKTGDKILAALEEEGTAKQYVNFMTFRTEDKVDIAMPNPEDEFDPADAPDEIYAGRWVRASIQPFFFDRDGGMGISFSLRNVQLLDSGPALTLGRAVVKASEEFGRADVDEEDEDVRPSRSARGRQEEVDERPRRGRREEPEPTSRRRSMREEPDDDIPFEDSRPARRRSLRDDLA
jgi:Protein of unknown function (DUF2815)